MHFFLQHLCIQFYFLSERQETAEIYRLC
ncbi:hypothetical protein PND88_22600 [Klebsiella pneumoniae]|nr:hypothetical protein [Klebsiella pneumoniae]MCZ9335225.1 hypothetical protein [Klebsiella pneumoniae]MDB7841558.1 hypothetical protein [Klebsiella pneumoniae]